MSEPAEQPTTLKQEPNAASHASSVPAAASRSSCTDSERREAAAAAARRKATAANPGREVQRQKMQEGGEPLEENLTAYRRSRNMGKDTRKLIFEAMKQDRTCALLDDDKINMVLNTMEYFEFKAGESVVKQGEVGRTFFVVHDGTLSVTVNKNQTNTMTRGQAFGGLALLYQCPRTASVTATSASSCWGASGSALNKVLQDQATKQYSENRKFLDSMQLLDGLTPKQKDIIAEGVFVESFERGSRVTTEGEAAAAIYSSKSGELRLFKGGKVSASGELVGGTESGRLKPGELFGDQELLRGGTYSATVIADSQSHMLCISSKHLKEALGDDVKGTLERALITSGLRRSPMISHLSAQQQECIAAAMQFQTYSAGQPIEDTLRIAVVIEGNVEGDGAAVTRGGVFEKSAEGFDERTVSRGSVHSPANNITTNAATPGLKRVAGINGCRLSILRKEAFAEALKISGAGEVSNESGALDFSRKLFVIRKVHVFRHLSNEQTDMLAKAFQSKSYQEGQFVFKQGDIGTSFYVIASGEVKVSIGGKTIRTMGRNAYFGERALLFEEPRSASIEVSSQEADIWSVEKTIFAQIIEGKMQQQLMERIKLQDTTVTMKDLKHIKVVGVGAAGVVRLVEHKSTKTRYALKRVKKKRGKIPEEVERECKLLAENDHPFVMHLVKTFETPKSVYMLTELITGGELHAAIRMIPKVLSRSQSQFYTGSLVLVLEELAGRGIVYRDLKPENVMLDAQGYLKLVDFGIAKKLAEGKNQTFTVIGTPHYMAPEVLQGRGYGVEVDIWSLGVLLYEFVCGYLPFADDLDNPTEVCQAVLKATLQFPSGYRDMPGKALMQGMLRRQPRKRTGAGINGYEDLKNHEYFQAGHKTTTLFDKILGRKLDPPVVPKGEKYADPDEVADASLSDAGELG